MSTQTNLQTRPASPAPAVEPPRPKLEHQAVQREVNEASVPARLANPAEPPRPPGAGLNRSFAQVRAVVNIADSDPVRAQATRELLERLASQLGLSPDSLEIHVDDEAQDKTARRGAGGLMEGGVVYLNPRQYTPRTREGKYLLGHEVAHAAQRATQPVGLAAPVALTEAELEAHQAGEALASGRLLRRMRVPLPDWHVAADIDAKRQALNTIVAGEHPGELARMHDLLSYHLLDWAITDEDVRKVLTILASFEMVAARSLVQAMSNADRDHLLDNLDTTHYLAMRTQVLASFWGCSADELRKRQSDVLQGLETMDLKQLAPLEAVAADYTVENLTDAGRQALQRGKKSEEIQAIRTFANDPETKARREAEEEKQIDKALKEEKTQKDERDKARELYGAKQEGKELRDLVDEIKETLSKFWVRDRDALGILEKLTKYQRDPLRLRAIADNLVVLEEQPPEKKNVYKEKKDYLDELIRQTPIEALYTNEEYRRVFFRLLTFRPGYKNEELAEKFAITGFFDLWMNSEDAYLAFLLVKALPEPARLAFYQLNDGKNWSNIQSKLSVSQRESETLNPYRGGENDKDRTSLLTQLLRDEVWTEAGAAQLDGLIRMAIAAGEHKFVFEQSKQRETYRQGEKLQQLVEKYKLYDPNGKDPKGNPRVEYSPELLEGTHWYETGLTGLLYQKGVQGVDFIRNSEDVEVFAKSLGGKGLNLAEFQDIFGGSFMGLRFRRLENLGLAGKEAAQQTKENRQDKAAKRAKAGLPPQPQRLGVNLADVDWDTKAGILTFKADELELDSLNYPIGDKKLQSRSGSASLVDLTLHYATGSNKRPSVLELYVGELVLNDVLLISADQMKGASEVDVSRLLVRAGSAGTDFQALAQPDEGFEWNIPGSIYRILGGVSGEAETLGKNILAPQGTPMGISLEFDSIKLIGVTTSSGQFVESLEIKDLALRGGGDIESYQKALDLSCMRLSVRLDKAKQAFARAVTPEDKRDAAAQVAELQRHLDKVTDELKAENAARAEIARLEAKKDKLEPAERDRLRALKAQFVGATLDVGSVSLKGVAGLTTGKVTLSNLHGQGRSTAGALGLLSSDKLVGFVAGEAGRPVVKGQDQNLFTLDVGRIEIPTIHLRGEIPTPDKAQKDYDKFVAKAQPWRPSYQAEMARLEERLRLAKERQALLDSPGIVNFDEKLRKQFSEKEARLEQLEAEAETTINRIVLENASIGVSESGRLNVGAEKLNVEDIRKGQTHIQSITGEDVKIDVDIDEGLSGLDEWRKNLVGFDLKGKTLVASGIENQETGLTVDRATLMGVEEASLAANSHNASANLVTKLILVEGVRLKNVEEQLIQERNYLKDKKPLTVKEQRRLVTLSEQLDDLDKLRKRVADAEAAKAKAKTAKQKAAAEADRKQAQADLDRWAQGLIVGTLSLRDVNVQAQNLGDVLSEDYDFDAALQSGIELRGRGGPTGTRLFSGGTATEVSLPGITGKQVTLGAATGTVKRVGDSTIFENVGLDSFGVEGFEWRDGARRAYSNGNSQLLNIKVDATVSDTQVRIDRLIVGTALADNMGYEDKSTGLQVAVESGGLGGIEVSGLVVDLPTEVGGKSKISKGQVSAKSVDDLHFNLLQKGIRAKGTLVGSGVTIDFVTDRKRVYTINELAVKGGEITQLRDPLSLIHVTLNKFGGTIVEETSDTGDTKYTFTLGLGNVTIGRSRWSTSSTIIEIENQATLDGISVQAEAQLRKKGDDSKLESFKLTQVDVARMNVLGLHVTVAERPPDPKKPGDEGASGKDIRLPQGTITGLRLTGFDVAADMSKWQGKVEVRKSLDLRNLKVTLTEKGKETLVSTVSIQSLGKEGGGAQGRELSATLLGPGGERLQLGTVQKITGEFEGYGIKTGFSTDKVTVGVVTISADGSLVTVPDVEIHDLNLTSPKYTNKDGDVITLATANAPVVHLKQLEARFGEVTDDKGKKSQGLTNLDIAGLSFDFIRGKTFKYVGAATVTGPETENTTVEADSVELKDLELTSLSHDFNTRVTKVDAKLASATANTLTATLASTLAGKKTETVISGNVDAGSMHADLTLTGTKVRGKDWTSIDGLFELTDPAKGLGLTNVEVVRKANGQEEKILQRLDPAKGTGFKLTGAKVKFAPNGTFLLSFDELATTEGFKFEYGGVVATVPLARLKGAAVAARLKNPAEAFALLGATLDEIHVEGTQITYTVDRAAGSTTGGAAAKWTLDALAGLTGTVNFHITKHDVTGSAPITNGVIDFNTVRLTAHDPIEKNIKSAIDPKGIYVIPIALKDYQYKRENIPGATFESGDSRGSLNLQPLLEDLLNHPSGGPATQLTGLSGISINPSTLQAGEGKLGTDQYNTTLSGKALGKNKIEISSVDLGTDLNLKIPAFQSSKTEFEVKGQKGETGEVEAKMNVAIKGLGDASLKFTITLKIDEGTVKEVKFGDVTLTKEAKLRAQPGPASK